MSAECATLHDATNGSTALILASASGNPAIVSMLLNAVGTSPVEKDAEGRCPLLYAARRGHGDVLRMLLSSCVAKDLIGAHGVDVADETGLTPLMAAAQSGHVDAVVQLLAAAANVFARDDTGATEATRVTAPHPFRALSENRQ